MSIDKEKAQSLAASYLRERGTTGLIFSGTRFVAAGDDLSPRPDRDLWFVFFEPPPRESGAGCITGGLVWVIIDDQTLELSLFSH